MNTNTIAQDNGLEEILGSRPFNTIEVLKKASPKEIRDFLESLKDSKNQRQLAQLMFFQRYLNRFLPQMGKEIEKIAVLNHKEYLEQTSPDSLPYALARFSSEEQNLIAKHLAYIQLTQGCGGECFRRCGLDAVPGIRDRIPKGNLIWTLKKIAEDKERKQIPKIFYASDSLEIASDCNDFLLIAQTYYNLFKKPLEIVTSIPPGTEELYKETCKRKDPFTYLCVSLTEQNVGRLYKQGILKYDTLDQLPIPPGNNSKIPSGVFSEECSPNATNLVSEDSRDNVGIEGYKIPGRKYGFWKRTALIMTPYGVLNTISIENINKNYPQGRVVISVNSISSEPFRLKTGNQIDPYLKTCIVRYSDQQMSQNKSFYISNLSENARVLIDSDGRIIRYNVLQSEPGFQKANAF